MGNVETEPSQYGRRSPVMTAVRMVFVEDPRRLSCNLGVIESTQTDAFVI
jgi:hypothetical protein